MCMCLCARCDLPGFPGVTLQTGSLAPSTSPLALVLKYHFPWKREHPFGAFGELSMFTAPARGSRAALARLHSSIVATMASELHNLLWCCSRYPPAVVCIDSHEAGQAAWKYKNLAVILLATAEHLWQCQLRQMLVPSSVRKYNLKYQIGPLKKKHALETDAHKHRSTHVYGYTYMCIICTKRRRKTKTKTKNKTKASKQKLAH